MAHPSWRRLADRALPHWLRSLTGTDPLAVVVVTHDSAEHLPALLTALLAQLGPEDELVVVDNASRDHTVAVARRGGERVQVVDTGANLGFGGGCHVGARTTQSPLLFFLNPDSHPQAGCLERLRAAASEHPAWWAWQAAVLLPDGRINSGGGIVHYLGMGWAGDCGKSIASLPAEPSEVAFPSGAAMVVRRSAWEYLGGLDASYFLYCEDLDLGLRVWLAGQSVGLVPDARVVHRYEFDRNADKWFWLERNRLRTVLAVYPRRLLLLLAPALISAELALLVLAALDGWLPAKLRAQIAVLAELPRTLRRRRLVQVTCRVSARTFASHLTASLDSPYLPVNRTGWAARAQTAYWLAVQRVLGRGTR